MLQGPSAHKHICWLDELVHTENIFIGREVSPLCLCLYTERLTDVFLATEVADEAYVSALTDTGQIQFKVKFRRVKGPFV